VPVAAFTASPHATAPTSFSSSAGPVPGSLRDTERQQILSALEQTGWHRGKTAEILASHLQLFIDVFAITTLNVAMVKRA